MKMQVMLLPLPVCCGGTQTDLAGMACREKMPWSKPGCCCHCCCRSCCCSCHQVATAHSPADPFDGVTMLVLKSDIKCMLLLLLLLLQ
jgi:hypothetical protein